MYWEYTNMIPGCLQDNHLLCRQDGGEGDKGAGESAPVWWLIITILTFQNNNGKFRVSESLCLAINNIDYVLQYIEPFVEVSKQFTQVLFISLMCESLATVPTALTDNGVKWDILLQGTTAYTHVHTQTLATLHQTVIPG